MTWTPDKIEKLKKLWGSGISASQIATRLEGMSRNAVIGKAHRLNLSAKITRTKKNSANHSVQKNNEQIKSFKEHIEASIEVDLPIIVHSRNAEHETFEILNEYRNQKPKILMHCFTGSYEFFKEMEKLNSYFSASGIITFSNSLDLQKTFAKIPNNKLLVETDSPFLAPIPMRGKKNEPSFIKYTIKKLADLKKIDQIEMINITSKNFENLFFS